MCAPCCSVVPGVFGNQLQYCVASIKQLLQQALKASQTEVGVVNACTEHINSCSLSVHYTLQIVKHGVP